MFCKSSSVDGAGLVDFCLPLEDAISEKKIEKNCNTRVKKSNSFLIVKKFI